MFRVIKFGCFVFVTLAFISQTDAQIFRRWSPAPQSRQAMQQQYYSQQTQRNCPEEQRRLAQAQTQPNRVQYVLIPKQTVAPQPAAQQLTPQQRLLQTEVQNARQLVARQQLELQRLEQRYQQQTLQAQQSRLRQPITAVPNQQPQRVTQTYYLMQQGQRAPVTGQATAFRVSPTTQPPVATAYITPPANTIVSPSQVDIARTPMVMPTLVDAGSTNNPVTTLPLIEPAESTPQGTLRDSDVVPASVNLPEDNREGVSVLQTISEAVEDSDPGSLGGLELTGPGSEK